MVGNGAANRAVRGVGGGIGFGLYRQYPISECSEDIKDLEKYLKGRDAMLMKVCKDLSLDANLWMLYTDEDNKV